MKANHSTLSVQTLQELDPEVYEAIDEEKERQQTHIELIGSENFTLPAIMEAAGSVLTNKYAEGYPRKRYYGGCTHVDTIERLAIERAKELFGAEHANVQPHSGSQANTAVYIAMLNPGDKILTMSLEHGGHLTHGHPKNISGMLYSVVHYGVNLHTGTIDYNQLEELAKRENPKMITVGASAYSRIIDFKRMGEIARQCGALLMADMAHIAGLVAAGEHPSPVPHADVVTSTTHKTLRGARGGLILCPERYAKVIDSAVFPGVQGGPLMHIIAGKAVCFAQCMKPSFKTYQRQIVLNAKTLAEALKRRGFYIVSGGTDNHLMMVDLRPSHPNLTGKQAQQILDRAHITTNKNVVPGEMRSPFQTSGIRLGTAAVTSRGMDQVAMEEIAEAIGLVLSGVESEEKVNTAREQMLRLCERYPLPY